MDTIDEAYSLFCTERFASVSLWQILRLETDIGVKLPDDYRQYLLRYNGGKFTNPRIRFPARVTMFGYLRFMHAIGAPHTSMELGRKKSLAIFDDNDPPQVLPIGATLDGSLILMVTHAESNGAIVYKQAFGEFVFIARNITEFFGLLYKEYRRKRGQNSLVQQ